GAVMWAWAAAGPRGGARRVEPGGRWVEEVPFRSAPSLFSFAPKDGAFRAAAWLGVVLSVLALSSWPQRMGTAASTVVWTALWLLYLSFVNIGQTFYSFGWETLLCEVGFFTIFAGAARSSPNM